MALNLPPPTRVAIGTVIVQGQRTEVFLDPEWARYLNSLNTQVATTSNAVGQPGAPGTTGAAGAGVSMSDDSGSSVEFIPGPRGEQGPRGDAGPPLFLLQDQPETQEFTRQATQLNEAFIAPTLLNSWVSYDGGTVTNDPGYYKGADGTVHLRGLVRSGTVGIGTPIFTLPAGYRPFRNEIFAVVSNNAFGRVNVYSTGDVAVEVGSNVYTCLDGITFRAAGTY